MEGLSDTLIDIELCETSLIQRNEAIEQERRVAIRDLIAENYFNISSRKNETYQGPYRLTLSIVEDRLVCDVLDLNKVPLEQFSFSLKPFRRIIKEYFMICESYNKALLGASPSKIEALDMGRRSTHNEGGDLLKSRIKEFVNINLITSRRLFTLICVLHIR